MGGFANESPIEFSIQLMVQHARQRGVPQNVIVQAEAAYRLAVAGDDFKAAGSAFYGVLDREGHHLRDGLR